MFFFHIHNKLIRIFLNVIMVKFFSPCLENNCLMQRLHSSMWHSFLTVQICPKVWFQKKKIFFVQLWMILYVIHIVQSQQQKDWFPVVSRTPPHEQSAPLQQNTEQVGLRQSIRQGVADLCPCQLPHQVEFLSTKTHTMILVNPPQSNTGSIKLHKKIKNHVEQTFQPIAKNAVIHTWRTHPQHKTKPLATVTLDLDSLPQILKHSSYK